MPAPLRLETGTKTPRSALNGSIHDERSLAHIAASRIRTDRLGDRPRPAQLLLPRRGRLRRVRFAVHRAGGAAAAGCRAGLWAGRTGAGRAHAAVRAIRAPSGLRG